MTLQELYLATMILSDLPLPQSAFPEAHALGVRVLGLLRQKLGADGQQLGARDPSTAAEFYSSSFR